LLLFFSLFFLTQKADCPGEKSNLEKKLGWMRVALSTPGGLNEAEKKAKWNAWAHKVCMGQRERDCEHLCYVCVCALLYSAFNGPVVTLLLQLLFVFELLLFSFWFKQISKTTYTYNSSSSSSLID
jgi:hypothetical protein